jgi:hypothetical protein
MTLRFPMKFCLWSHLPGVRCIDYSHNHNQPHETRCTKWDSSSIATGITSVFRSYFTLNKLFYGVLIIIRVYHFGSAVIQYHVLWPWYLYTVELTCGLTVTLNPRRIYTMFYMVVLPVVFFSSIIMIIHCIGLQLGVQPCRTSYISYVGWEWRSDHMCALPYSIKYHGQRTWYHSNAKMVHPYNDKHAIKEFIKSKVWSKYTSYTCSNWWESHFMHLVSCGWLWLWL